MMIRSLFLICIALSLIAWQPSSGARYWGKFSGPDYSGVTLEGPHALLPLRDSFTNEGPTIATIALVYNIEYDWHPIRLRVQISGPRFSRPAVAHRVFVDMKHWVWTFGPLNRHEKVSVLVVGRFVHVPHVITAFAAWYANPIPSKHDFGYPMGGLALDIPIGG